MIKKISLSFLFGMVSLFLLGSCVSQLETVQQSVQKKFAKEESVEKVSLIDISLLDEDDVKAFVAMEKAKLGTLDTVKTYPYTRIANPDLIRLKNTTDYSQFGTEKIAFTEYSKDPSKTRNLEAFCLSVDELGRQDLSRNRIAYKVEKPTEAEAEAIKKSLQQNAQMVRHLEDRKLDRIVKTVVKGYQNKKGLTVDGIIGNQTIGSLLQDISIIEIQELTTEIVYPEKPGYEAYIIEADAMGTDQFDIGFNSIQTVRKHALTLQEFKNNAEPGKDFLACIYFFDRVNPWHEMKWGFATDNRGRAAVSSTVFYAGAETWPMIVESFTTESGIENEELYINLYRKTGGFLGSNQIVGSCKIK